MQSVMIRIGKQSQRVNSQASASKVLSGAGESIAKAWRTARKAGRFTSLTGLSAHVLDKRGIHPSPVPRREPKCKDKVDADEGKKEKGENQDDDHKPKSWSSWRVRHDVDL